MRSSVGATVALGTAEAQDFEDVHFDRPPSIVFFREEEDWRGFFNSSVLTSKPGASGTFVVVLPADTRVAPRPSRYASLLVQRSARATVVRVVYQHSSVGSATAGRAGAAELSFAFSFPPDKIYEESPRVGVSSLTPPRTRRIGHGREHFAIRYVLRPPAEPSGFVPLLPLVSGDQGDVVDQRAARRHKISPVYIGFAFDEADKELTNLTPDPSSGIYDERLWRVDIVQSGLLIEGVVEDRRTRWWVERAPDYLFTALGYLLGAWVVPSLTGHVSNIRSEDRTGR